VAIIAQNVRVKMLVRSVWLLGCLMGRVGVKSVGRGRFMSEGGVLSAMISVIVVRMVYHVIRVLRVLENCPQQMRILYVSRALTPLLLLMVSVLTVHINATSAQAPLAATNADSPSSRDPQASASPQTVAPTKASTLTTLRKNVRSVLVAVRLVRQKRKWIV